VSRRVVADVPPPAGYRTIVILAVPMSMGLASQAVLNAVDAAMVGSLGSSALGACGLAGLAFLMATASINGISAGVQVAASRRHGAGHHHDTSALAAGLRQAVALVLPMTGLLFVIAPYVLPLLHDDPRVVALAGEYMDMRLLGLPAAGLNFALRGHFNGINRPRVFLGVTLGMHAINVVASAILVFGLLGAPELGVAGSGLGSTIASYAGTAAYVLAAGGPRAVRAPVPAKIRRMVRSMLFPVGFGQTLFAAGSVTFLAIAGQMGVHELAAANGVVTVIGLGILPAVGCGMAAASLVSQALGAAAYDRARAWASKTAHVAALATACVLAPMALMPDLMAVVLHEHEALELAEWPIRIVAVALPIDAMGMVLFHSLIGADRSRLVLSTTTAIQWLVFLPATYVAVRFGDVSLTTIFVLYAGYRVTQAATLAVLWRLQRLSASCDE